MGIEDLMKGLRFPRGLLIAFHIFRLEIFPRVHVVVYHGWLDLNLVSQLSQLWSHLQRLLTFLKEIINSRTQHRFPRAINIWVNLNLRRELRRDKS
jgi:hypothetical protein